MGEAVTEIKAEEELLCLNMLLKGELDPGISGLSSLEECELRFFRGHQCDNCCLDVFVQHFSTLFTETLGI